MSTKSISQMQVCEVCRLLDGDDSKKPCTYCEPCQAWLCKKDNKDIIRRGFAWWKRAYA